MRSLFFFLLVFMLSVCSPATGTLQPNSSEDEGLPALPVLGQAPELENDIWINTSGPLRLSALKGKVVLLDMWTFG
jgi:hypothetical protein